MIVPESRPLSADELLRLYDWPRADWVRACMVMTLDGGATGPDGLSRSISSAVDRAVMNAIRAGADAYLVGAGTVRAERYRAVRAIPAVASERVARGQRPAPVLAVVSGSCRFDWATTDFTHSDNRPVVLTCEAAHGADRRAAADAGCEVVVVGDQQVDVAGALATLRHRGLARVTCEGGPVLLHQLVRGDLIDEVDLTVSPTMVGAPMPGRPGRGVLARMALRHLVEDDGFLFTSYVRAGES